DCRGRGPRRPGRRRGRGLDRRVVGRQRRRTWTARARMRRIRSGGHGARACRRRTPREVTVSALRSAIGPRLVRGLAAGFVLAALASAPARATITIVNMDGPNEGFNDPTPAAPVGGNSGTTVGQQ